MIPSPSSPSVLGPLALRLSNKTISTLTTLAASHLRPRSTAAVIAGHEILLNIRAAGGPGRARVATTTATPFRAQKQPPNVEMLLLFC